MTSSLPQPGALLADKYQIESVLGEGAMGTVLRARHLLMERSVALKVMQPELAQHPEARDRFLREARAAGRIRHPNVVDVYDVGEHEGALYMVMELLEGEHFEHTMRRGDVPTETVLQLLVGAMRGVAAAHRHGIVHRDVKPENLFVLAPTAGAEARVKVLDFGISKLVDEPHRTLSLTHDGTVVGTPLFMSFEQLSGARDVDARSDVYSFGVLMYRALTGVLPFDAESVAAIAVLIATYRPPSPDQLRPELPPALAHVVMKAMAFERDARHESLEALIDDLARIGVTDAVRGGGAASRGSSLAPRAPSRPSLPSIEIAAPAGPAGSMPPLGQMPAWLRTGALAAIVLIALAAGVYLGRAQPAVVSIEARPESPPLPQVTGAVTPASEPPLAPAPSLAAADALQAPAPARDAATPVDGRAGLKPGRAGKARAPAPPSPSTPTRTLLRRPDF